MTGSRTTGALNNGNEGDSEYKGHIASPPPSTLISTLASSNEDDATPPKIEIKTQPIDYLEPDYKSFDEIKPTPQKAFIKAATTHDKNFIEWALEQNDKEWIRKPNANTDQELIIAVNHGADNYENSSARGLAVGAYSVATGIVSVGLIPYYSTRNITPGQIHFSNDRGKMLIHVTPGLHTLTALRHSWHGQPQMLSTDTIKEGIVTITRILPGHIGLAFDKGHPVVLLPGRHAYNSALFVFEASNVKNVTNTDFIEHNILRIIRVRTQELGLGSENGNPIILLPGLHIQNSASFEYSKKLNTHTLTLEGTPTLPRPSNVFVHETITIARVDKNQLGKAQDGSESHLLQPGLYINNTRSFRFDGVENANAPHINYNNIHRIQVPSDKFAKVWDNNNAALLPPLNQPYEINSSTFQYDELVSAKDSVIKHGSITRVVVKDGEIGFAWDHGKAVELEQKIHVRDDPQFIFDKCVPANQDVIQFGHITYIIVPEGQARAVWLQGELKVLTAGRHPFTSPTLKISSESIPLQNIVKPLKEIKVNTKDRTPMHVTGQVTYRITNPKMFVMEMGQDKFQASLETTTDAIIRQQIAQTDLSMISPATHTKPSLSEDKESKEESRALPLMGADSIRNNDEGSNFRGKLCHTILTKLQENTRKWGIEIDEFAISDISFQDKAVEKDLADATANTRKAEAQYDLQRAKNLTEIIAAETEAKKLLIKQENAASIGNIEATAKATQMQTAAEAKAQADFIAKKKAAEGEVAAAQAKSVAAKAIAEAERDANLAKATGLTALATADAVNYNNPGYVQLKMAEYQVQMALHLSKRQVPAMQINSGENENGATSGMFFNQGITMFNTAQAIRAQEQQKQIEPADDKKDNVTIRLKS